MAKSKGSSRKSQEDEQLTLNQGFVKASDLEPQGEQVNIMKPSEVDRYAREAESQQTTQGEDLQGEGNHEAAENYNQAATDFARKKHSGGQ